MDPTLIVSDTHPDYYSTRRAKQLVRKAATVQHHVAHVISGVEDNELRKPLLAVAWDGTGEGADGTSWGGEFFTVKGKAVKRVGFLRRFWLPGADNASRDCWRAACGATYEILGLEGIELVCRKHPEVDRRMGIVLEKRINCVLTSSAGRLFDAVAAILVGIHHADYEGEAGHLLESLALECPLSGPGMTVQEIGDHLEVDWGPTLMHLLELDPRIASFLFHRGLAEAITGIAQKVGLRDVLLTGGCFQNRLLTSLTWACLTKAGFCPHGHRNIPPNDSGIAFGQVASVVRRYRSLD